MKRKGQQNLHNFPRSVSRAEFSRYRNKGNKRNSPSTLANQNRTPKAMAGFEGPASMTPALSSLGDKLLTVWRLCDPPSLSLSLWCKACLSFAITFPLGPGLVSPLVSNTYTAVASSRSGLSHESCHVLGGRHDSVGCRESGRTKEGDGS